MSYEALVALAETVGGDTALHELVRLRCSQINGCTFCVRLHTAGALGAGETQDRIDDLPRYEVSSRYTTAERSALALAEAVTLVHDGHVPDGVLAAAKRDHGDAATTQLIWVAIVTNSFNRLAISTRFQGRSLSVVNASVRP